MALTFLDLRTEFYMRGFEYLSNTAPEIARANRWLNRAMHKIDGAADWPYLNTTTTGNSPLTIADLRTIETVYDVTNRNRLVFADRRDLRQDWGDITITGMPYCYFITLGTTINVFPVATVPLSVDYWKFGNDMVADVDQPLMPDRFRSAIIEYAVADALKDDESQDSGMAQQTGDQILAEMREVLLDQQHGDRQWVVPAVGGDC